MTKTFTYLSFAATLLTITTAANAEFVPTEIVATDTIEGTTEKQYLGYSADFVGNQLFIGAASTAVGTPTSNSVYIYNISDNGKALIKQIISAPSEADKKFFGFQMAASESYLAVYSSSLKKVYIYAKQDDGSWTSDTIASINTVKTINGLDVDGDRIAVVENNQVCIEKITKDGDKYILVDTAGIRRKNKIYEDIERYSVIRAIAAIERSDVCLLMMDATSGISDQDKRIAGLAHESGKGIVVCVNKWDALEKETNTMKEYRKRIAAEFPFMSYAPVIFISALTGQRLDSVLETVKTVSENRSVRIPTGQLNSLISDAVMMKHPPSDKGKSLKIYYATQIGIRPPLFSFKVNSRQLMHFSYSRYLENRIRETYGFEGTSIKFVFREKGDKEDV